jgi:hypothetical protein
MQQLGSGLRIGIVHARWNTKIIDALLSGTKKALAKAGVKDENIVIQSVPGSYELPYAVRQYGLSLSYPCTETDRVPPQTLLRVPSPILVHRHRWRSRRPARLCHRPHVAHTLRPRDVLAAIRRRHRYWRAYQGRDDAL